MTDSYESVGLDCRGDSVLRQPHAFVTMTMRDGTTRIAQIVRRHDGGSTLRVREVGQSASTLVLIRDVIGARWARRAEINAAIDAAKSKTSEQTVTTPHAMGTSAVVAARSGAPVAPTTRAIEPRESLGRGSFTPPSFEQRASSVAIELFNGRRSAR